MTEFVKTCGEAIALMESGGNAIRLIIGITAVDTLFVSMVISKITGMFKRAKKDAKKAERV